jgi:hypothetical protein
MGRIGLLALGFFIAWIVLMLTVGVLGSSNLVWGEPNQYGRIDVPGEGALHLPTGTVDVAVAAEIVGRGNQTPNFPLPADLALSVTPVSGSAHPTVIEALGHSSNANADGADTLRHVWKVQLPADGRYRVGARGRFAGAVLNPQLWFGRGPPLPGALVPVVAAALAVVGGVGWLVVRPRIRGRLPPRRQLP